MRILTILFTALVMVLLKASALLAQENADPPISICQAIAQYNQLPRHKYAQQSGMNELPLLYAAFELNYAQSLQASEVRISYVGHSTYRIEGPDGLIIATDYSGFAGVDVIPDVVTMNHAHGTHFTITPDPRIPHVLRGWGMDGNPAKHFRKIGEAVIRNVTTDINNQWAGYEPNGNSIFIFEMSGLCIGHLGHLHHLLTDEHYAKIGRLDVLMVPVDGGYTLSVADMTKIAKRVRASLILPMHWFGMFSLERFLSEASAAFPVEMTRQNSFVLSLNSLPPEPVVRVLLPESSFSGIGGD